VFQDIGVEIKVFMEDERINREYFDQIKIENKKEM
jgi:hypothetical protein